VRHVFFPVLQCVAVCCSVLQCVAVCCSVLQYVAEPSCARYIMSRTCICVELCGVRHVIFRVYVNCLHCHWNAQHPVVGSVSVPRPS